MIIKEQVGKIIDEMIQVRRELHKFPELSEMEFVTAEKISEQLEKYNIEHKCGIGGTGIVAIVRGKKSGKTVAAKADIDALPIQEKTEVPYKSCSPGIMHACGHDANSTILLGTAIVLKAMEEQLIGNVKFFFESAEETIGGGKLMVEQGAMENPKVDSIIGLHVMPYLEVGQVELKYGCLNASTNEVYITVHGKSGHAASPENTVDPVVVAAHVIVALQTLVSRNVSPTDSVVLTFGTINGGTKGNIIPDEVTMKGTLRTLSNEQREFAKNKVRLIAENTAKALGATAEVEITDSYNALISDDKIIDVIIKETEKTLGKSAIIMKKEPSMGAEDFSYYTENAKGAYFHIGCGNQRKNIVSDIHTETFDIDEDCIALGIELQTEIMLKLLQ
ncbi:MAG: M20 family metallopeptidase [Anaerovoracaceae bacterium]